MRTRKWVRAMSGFLAAGVCVVLTGCPRQPVGNSPGAVDPTAGFSAQPSTADHPFPESLEPEGAGPITANSMGDRVPPGFGSHDDARGHAARATALGVPVYLFAWEHADLGAAREAWAKAGEAVGAVAGDGGWLEAKLESGSALRCATFTDSDARPWIVAGVSESPEAAAEAACLTRASLGLTYPDAIGDLKLAEPAKEYDRKTVFDPIDGAAEQYFRYHFARFYRGEYRQDEGKVVTDVYELASSADAFGVQSAFLTQRTSNIGQQGYLADSQLTFWQGPYFCRLQAYDMGDRAGDALEQIGTALSEALAVRGPAPDMVRLVERLQPEPLSIHFFHTVEELTPQFYISTANVLGLDLDTDCLVAKLPPEGSPVTLLVVRYPDADRAQQALDGLLQVVLPNVEATAGVRVGEWEPGRWVGTSTTGKRARTWLAAVFDADGAEGCRELLETVMGRIP
jgi:hypothetical protein